MALYAIADLHFSFTNPKPMDIFGKNWENHEKKIKNDWIKKVKKEDVVIIPGDISWAMTMEEAYYDFKFIHELPGKKIILKGNHDYYWNTQTKLRNFIIEKKLDTIEFIHNNAQKYKKTIIVGTRGWNINSQSEDDLKIINREANRLELSIKYGIQKFKDYDEIIAFIHYPPITNKVELKDNVFLQTMKKYNIKKCYYGHLHGESHKDAIEGKINDIEFELISADYIDFKLKKVLD